jgi:FkbM family methyltransferase
MKIRSGIIISIINLLENIFFYPRLKRYLKDNLGESDIIIDVGANRGQSIDIFRSIWKKAKIYSFEPNHELFQYLETKYSGDQNVILRNEGVSSETGEKIFYINQLDLTSSFSELNYESKYLETKGKILGYSVHNIIKNAINVSVIRLLDFIKNEGLEVIDLIKIDTEGHEYECLVGLFSLPEAKRKFHVRFIQLEDHKDDMYLDRVDFDDIHALLEDNGYFLSYNIKHPFGNYFEKIYKYKNEA